MPPTGSRVDPFGNFNFLIEIDDTTSEANGLAGRFTECSGIESTTEVIPTFEGGSTEARKSPGQTTYSDITLKWGITNSMELWNWRKKIIDGQVERKNGSIILFDHNRGNEVARWNFSGAWPTKWEGPSLDASANEMAVETLVLAVERIVRG